MKNRGAEPAQNDTVTLKPVLGIPPTTYVPALLALAVVLLLFLMFIRPGIVNNGARVTFETVPEGASVLVDGTRQGATPLAVFVERGVRTVTLRRPHFEELSFDVEVPGRIVGSLFVPRQITVSRSLQAADTRAIAESAAREFNRWSMVGEANAQYQFEAVLSEAVLDLTVAEDAAADTADLLDHAVRDVHTEALLKDYIRALALAESEGRVFAGIQALGLLRDAAARIAAEPGLAYLVAAALPDEAAAELEGTAWFDTTTGSLVTDMLTETEEGEPDVPDSGRFTIAGQVFVEVPARSFVMGLQTPDGDAAELNRPHVAGVGRFFMMETEVTRRLYRRFVSEQPEWAPSARDDLVAAELVTEDYLRDWGDGSAVDQSTRPVRFVSYHAAVAFCAWLSDQLPPALTGFEARLPTEAEWEWAATLNASEGYPAVFADTAISTPLPVGSSEPGRLGIYDLLGNVWEWTGDWYHPGAYLLEAEPLYPGTQRVVRGGSWANDRRSIRTATRGAQPPEWSTAFLGFRPVIAEETP